MSGQRYQSGYDDGFKAGKWAGRSDLPKLLRELRDALAAAMRVMANYDQASYYWRVELDKLGIPGGTLKRADDAIAEAPKTGE